MDEHKLIQERERAQLAKQLTDNPLWSEFFDEAEQRLIAMWKDSASPELREDAWRYTKLLVQMKKFMEQALITGQMAEIALAEMQEKEDGGRNPKH